MEQTFGDLDSALQSARERLDEVACTVAQVEFDQEMIDPLVKGRTGEAIEMPLVRQVFVHAQFFVEAGCLENDANASAQGRGVAQQIKPQN